MSLADQIYLGTCAFSAPGWSGSFYPKGMKAEDRLTFYAEHPFSTRFAVDRPAFRSVPMN